MSRSDTESQSVIHQFGGALPGRIRDIAAMLSAGDNAAVLEPGCVDDAAMALVALADELEAVPAMECKSHADDDDDGWPDLEHLERELIAARPVSTAALLVVIDRAKSKATECRSVTQSDAERAFAMLAEHERDTVRNLALSMQEVGHIEEADVIFRAMGESDD